jgi:hypothetical protein
MADFAGIVWLIVRNSPNGDKNCPRSKNMTGDVIAACAEAKVSGACSAGRTAYARSHGAQLRTVRLHGKALLCA